MMNIDKVPVFTGLAKKDVLSHKINSVVCI